MKRPGSENLQFAQRIPADIRPRAIGQTLAIPCGPKTVKIAINPKTESIRFSLGTRDPAEAKIRQALAIAYLGTVWKALREAAAPVDLTNKQATALAGELYRAWADGEGRERTVAAEWDGERMVPASVTPAEEALFFGAAAASLDRLAATEKPEDLERPLGEIIDRLLLAKGIASVTPEARAALLSTFYMALRDAFAARQRNAGGDYSPDPNAARFPEWQRPTSADPTPAQGSAKTSLKDLVEDWWREAQAAQSAKPSTYESYRNTVANFVAFLKHEDASRVRPEDVIAFKDHRLNTINPRTGKPISAKTVKDSDLAGLKTVFGWGVTNLRIATNPATKITLKVGKPAKLRSKSLSDAEAKAILSAAMRLKKGSEQARTFAAKRWIPWLCAYTGARVGEVGQLRKEDVRCEDGVWVVHITPEAGTVKTNDARDVALHSHIVEQGFPAFVAASSPGHLFVKPGKNGNVRGPLKGMANHLREFIRTIVPDQGVAPNHGWRHRFKTVGLEAGIDHRILDAIQGQAARTVSETYGEVTVKTMAAAMAKFPKLAIGGV